MRLYDVTAELEKIIDDYELETEEQLKDLPPEIKAKLQELQVDANGMLYNIWGMIKNLDAEADALKAEKQRLAARQSTAERRAEWLKQYVALCIGEGTRWQSADGSRKFSWRKSEAVEVVDRESIPDCYRVFDWKPALTEIKKDLKSGAEVPGAEIVQRLNLQVG